ncbi:hypothetical protein OEZ85_007194 [Tetradesmus obliquus]|uniref:MPN domain-containing protein n=1 Tax=Tetradesmus obliquus TaxID=3088 RepID=A0ABY8TWZ9_TETOB|nr:hypothetical protein OEZ85_007194 [Tetradesmus obliquus]
MPAPRKPVADLVGYLNSQAPTLPVNQSISLAHYYRSADLLQAQATAYRAANNEEQLYVMLVRLISLVVETISKHRLCVKTSAQHEKYLKQVVAAAAEAEKLKIILRTKHIPQPRAYTSRRPANTVQITDTNALPDIDWAGAAAPPPAAAAAAAAGIASAGYVPLDSDLEWPPSVAEAAAAAAAGPKSLSKRLDLRDVHISVALMNDFLHYAANNTRRGIESCGILAGRLSASDSRFTITTLIVPKQTGTSDTVEMLGEEEVWEAESSRELVPLGWIHTHPTQTCFLSSVDIHTQCGYQTMLEESVAIVMAPTDSRKKCGIFRLTTPAGLEHVQRCSYRGFHASCNSEMYELCGHVYLNPNAKHEVIDLR